MTNGEIENIIKDIMNKLKVYGEPPGNKVQVASNRLRIEYPDGLVSYRLSGSSSDQQNALQESGFSGYRDLLNEAQRRLKPEPVVEAQPETLPNANTPPIVTSEPVKESSGDNKNLIIAGAVILGLVLVAVAVSKRGLK